MRRRGQQDPSRGRQGLKRQAKPLRAIAQAVHGDHHNLGFFSGWTGAQLQGGQADGGLWNRRRWRGRELRAGEKQGEHEDGYPGVFR